jgi:acyl-CoA synthetase (NDP forming)/RimJ/RimL family protein N-acetyltransferase
VVLRDGHTVHVRPIVPGDADRLMRFHARQSPESIYFRYFSPRPELSERDVQHFTVVDHRDRVAFIALSEDEMVGVARYERYRGTDTAEVAFFIDDAHQGRGLAALLLEYLAEAGRDNGLRRFTATTLPHNRKMLRVFTTAGYDVATRLDEGVVEVAFDIAPTVESFAAMERRERVAEAASVRRMLRPGSVAVVGAGRGSDGLGAGVFRNLLTNGFRGTAYAVNRDAAAAGEQVMGVTAYATVEDLPEAVDLVVVAVPAAEVPGVVERCGRRGVGGVAVLSAGFSEESEEGAELERQVVDSARLHGIRLLGPNCLGIVNTDESVRLDATLVPALLPPGRIGMLTESGLLSAAIIDHAVRAGLGMSTFVAAGNRADVAATDLLSYWIEDDDTDAVLMYLAARALPPRFVRAARAASMDMPVAALHTAMAGVGDHTGTSRRVVRAAERRAEAVFRQTGVISVPTLGQLFDLGRVLADQPVPAGHGVAVVGNSDGAVALAADACLAAGLELVPVETTGSRGQTVSNPVNLTHRATAADYSRVLGEVAADPAVHSIVVIHTPPRTDLDTEVVDALLAATEAAPEVTFVATVLGSGDLARFGGDGGPAVPAFPFPEDAVQALGRLAAYRAWRRAADRFASAGPEGCDADLAREVVAAALERRGPGEQGAVALDHRDQEALLASYRIDVVPRRVVHDDVAAVAAAEEIGWPVVLKAHTRNRRARSAASGVALDVVDRNQLRVVWARMEQLLDGPMAPAVVQHFVDEGVDVAVTVTRHPDGAGTVEVGLGGPAAISGSVELGVLPLTLGDASALVANSPVGRVLTDPLDRVRIVEVVHRLAALVEDHDAIRRVYADPVVVTGSGAAIADVQITVDDAVEEFTVRRLE